MFAHYLKQLCSQQSNLFLPSCFDKQEIPTLIRMIDCGRKKNHLMISLTQLCEFLNHWRKKMCTKFAILLWAGGGGAGRVLKVSFYCTSISHLTHLNSQLLSLHPLHTFTSYISLCTSVCFRIFSCGYQLWHFLQFDTQSLIALNTFENTS